MKISLLFFLASATLARAFTYVGDQTFVAPFDAADGATLVGNVTLTTPGTYRAAYWNFVGNLRFGTPGSYTLVATSGAINLAGQLISPGGATTLHVHYRSALTVVGRTSMTDVTLIDDTKTVVTPGGDGSNPITVGSAPLLNLSTRVTLGAGASVNSGFIVGGTTPRRVLVRAIGPGLAPFIVAEPLPNPMVAVYGGNAQVAANDDWNSADPDLRSAMAAVGAFTPLGKDAAILLTLQPGAYTAVVKSSNATDTGEVLLEVYLVD